VPLHALLLVIAVVLFVIGAFTAYWAGAPRLNILALGLAFFAASFYPS
jgi:hypothetical protein